MIDLKEGDIPQPMQRPTIHRPRRRRRIPKLRLQQLSPRRIETAQILHHSLIMTAQLGHRTGLREPANHPLPACKKHLRAPERHLAERAETRHCVGIWCTALERQNSLLYRGLHGAQYVP